MPRASSRRPGLRFSIEDRIQSSSRDQPPCPTHSTTFASRRFSLCAWHLGIVRPARAQMTGGRGAVIRQRIGDGLRASRPACSATGPARFRASGPALLGRYAARAAAAAASRPAVAAAADGVRARRRRHFSQRSLPAPVHGARAAGRTVFDNKAPTRITNDLLKNARLIASPEERSLALQRIANGAIASRQLFLAHQMLEEATTAASEVTIPLVRDQRLIAIVTSMTALTDAMLLQGRQISE